MKKTNTIRMYGLVALLTGLMMASTWAGTVVDMNFTEVDGTDYSPARSASTATSTQLTYDWSASSALFNGPTASSRKIYGGINTTGASDVGGTASILWDGGATSDYLLISTSKGGASVSHTTQTLMLWDSADFLSSDNKFDTSAGSSFTIDIGAYANVSGGNNGLRFVIRDGSTYYVSSAAVDTTGVITVSGATSGLQWGSFNAANFASYDDASGDLGLGVSFSSMTFSDVTGIGFIADVDRPNTADALIRVNDFQVALVPEPATMGLFAVLGSTLIFVRRRLTI